MEEVPIVCTVKVGILHLRNTLSHVRVLNENPPDWTGKVIHLTGSAEEGKKKGNARGKEKGKAEGHNNDSAVHIVSIFLANSMRKL